MKVLATLVLAFVATLPCQAQSFLATPHERPHPSFGHVWHYITTHKELLTSDAVGVLGWSADAASIVYDQHHCTCVETNAVLGKNASEGAIWTYGIGLAGVQATFSHLIWHYAPDQSDRHLIWFLMAPFAVSEAFNVDSNAGASGTKGAVLAVPRPAARIYSSEKPFQAIRFKETNRQGSL